MRILWLTCPGCSVLAGICAGASSTGHHGRLKLLLALLLCRGGVRQYLGSAGCPRVVPAPIAVPTRSLRCSALSIPNLAFLFLLLAATRQFQNWALCGVKRRYAACTFLLLQTARQCGHGFCWLSEVSECLPLPCPGAPEKGGCCPDCAQPRRPARWRGAACTPRRRASRSC